MFHFQFVLAILLLNIDLYKQLLLRFSVKNESQS